MRHTTRLLEPHYFGIATGIVALILYGSFYPFHFYSHQDSRGLVGVLLDSGFQPASRDDVVSNILLYMPLGFFAVYAIKRRAVRSRAVSGVAVAVTVGFLLSLTVELAQFYARGRVQELTDICSNTLGALLGASGAAVARRWVSPPFPTLILACWLGNRWYPAPQAPSSIPALDLFRYFVAWLAVGLILEALCGGPRSRAALPALLAVSLLVRALAVNVEPMEIAGGAVAALLWSSGLWGLRARGKIEAVLFVALVVLLALAPFEFSGTAARSDGSRFAASWKLASAQRSALRKGVFLWRDDLAVGARGPLHRRGGGCWSAAGVGSAADTGLSAGAFG